VSDRVSVLEERIAELAEAHRQLEHRVSALERRPAAAVAARRAAPPATPIIAGQDLGRELAPVTKNVGLVGRTLLVLAGAFLIRAITEAGSIPAWAGAALGFVYACGWMAMAYRVGGAQPSSAVFHGASALLIGFPLLFEVSARLRLLAPAAAVAALILLTTAALAVAARRRLRALAWLVELGGVLTAVALMLATGHLVPPVLYLALLGVATLWLGYVLEWRRLRWPVALVTDLAVVVLTLRAVVPAAAEGPRAALLVQLVVTALYLGSIALRTLLLQRAVVEFEVVQTALLLAAGVGGASYVTARAGMAEGVVGLVSAAFGVALYAVAFAFVERRQRGKANFYFYASTGIVFVLAGTGQLLSAEVLAVGWAALAVLSSALARRFRRLTLAVHGCVYAVAACLPAGALIHAATTLVAAPSVRWPDAPRSTVVVVAAMAASAWLTGHATDSPLAPRQRVPRSILLAAAAVTSAGLAVGWLVPLVAGAPGPRASAALAASVRTAVMVGGVLLLAWAGRFPAWREAGWLAYPLLVVVGLKLVLENLARSRPSSLFVDFALFGTALILVPRLRRYGASTRPASPRPAAAGGAS
jgi:hypothetical protein